MPLIVEDGTMPVGANCYVDVAEVDAAATNLNDTAWLALTVADKERYIITGCLVVDDGGTYRYSGDPKTATQYRVWPRTNATLEAGGPAIPDTFIPIQIRQANTVAALGLLKGTVTPPSGSSAPANRYVTNEKVGDLSVSYALASMGSGGVSATGPYDGLGNSEVTALVAPLLDTTFYSEQGAAGSSVTGALAATRGPRFTAPAYGGLWNVGMHDNSINQQVDDGIA